jgi:hypothetical protein
MSTEKGMSPKLLAMFAVAVVTLVGLIGWFALVAPQHSKATTLDGRIAEAKEQLKVAKLLARSEKAGKGKASGLGLLETAMPAELQMPSVLRQVQRLASVSNVSLLSFSPSAAAPADGYSTVPIALSVTGRYASLQSFLKRLRVLAGSKSGRIHASGRLFDVGSVSLSPSAPPELTAAIALTTFVYTGTPLPVPGTTTTTSEDSSASAAAEGTS